MQRLVKVPIVEVVGLFKNYDYHHVGVVSLIFKLGKLCIRRVWRFGQTLEFDISSNYRGEASVQCFIGVSNHKHQTKLAYSVWFITWWIINEFEKMSSKLFEIIGMHAHLPTHKPTVKPLTPSDKPLISFLGPRSDSGKSAPVTVMAFVRGHRPIRLTQCCTQFKSLGVKVLCVFYLHYNVAFTFKWYGNTWNKTFYFQRIWIGYNMS